MKRVWRIIARSFPLRMSLNILMVANLVFIFSFWGYFYQARKTVVVEAVEQAQEKLNNTILQIEMMLNSVEVAVENLSWVVTDR